jgi:hypothetical protein
MKLQRLIFSHSALSQLPKAEQLFFVRLAHVRNDLRHIDSLCQIALHSVRSTTGVEQDVSLHQFLFAVRLLYGVLNESLELIRRDWLTKGLGQQIGSLLTKEARASLSLLKNYLSKNNLMSKMRNQFAFHYLSDNLSGVIRRARTDDHTFITGRLSGNVFYVFAEKLHNAAIVEATDETEVRSAVRRFYNELSRIRSHFVRFSDAVLFEVGKKLGIRTQSFETTAVIDPADVSSVIFMDENNASSK